MIYVVVNLCSYFVFFCFKQKTAYEMRSSDWSSDVCSSDLLRCFGFRSSPFLGATLLRGRPFALQCLAFRWREAEIAIYAPFAGYPEPVIAECAGRTLIEVEDGPAILAPMPVAVATKSYQLARCYSRREDRKSTRLNSSH